MHCGCVNYFLSDKYILWAVCMFNLMVIIIMHPPMSGSCFSAAVSVALEKCFCLCAFTPASIYPTFDSCMRAYQIIQCPQCKHSHLFLLL